MPYNIFLKPLISKKTGLLKRIKKYTFITNREVNKGMIKYLKVEFLTLNIVKINTINIKRKKVYFRKKIGFTNSCKKIIFTSLIKSTHV